MEHHSGRGEGGTQGGEEGRSGGGGGGGAGAGAGGCGGTQDRPAQPGQDGAVILLPSDVNIFERRPDEIVNRNKKSAEKPKDCEKKVSFK